MKEDDENRVDELMEQVRQDMMNERTRKLQEHQENISATIAKLQIEKAKQVYEVLYIQPKIGNSGLKFKWKKKIRKKFSKNVE